MNLANFEWNLNIPLEENRVTVLVIENSSVLVSMLQELYRQGQGEEGAFVIADGEKIYSFPQVAHVILEPFTLSCNEKKILNKLYHEITEEANTVFYEKTNHLHGEILRYLDELLLHIPYPVTYAEEMDVSSLLKMMRVIIAEDADSFLEKLVDFVRIISALTGVKVLFFLNLKSYLTKEELLLFYKEVRYTKLYPVLIENKMYDKLEEDVCIIDSDMCIIFDV